MEFSRQARPGWDVAMIRAESGKWIKDWAKQAKGTPQEEAVGLLKSLPEQLGDWGVIDSIISDGTSLYVDVIDRRQVGTIADRTTYPAARLTLTADSGRCRAGHVAVKIAIRIWVESCRNGIGYWSHPNDHMCTSAARRLPLGDLLFGQMTMASAVSSDGPDTPGPDGHGNPDAAIQDAPDWGSSEAFSALRFALCESMTRAIHDLGAVMDAIEAEFALSPSIMDTIKRCFTDDPGNTEFHVVMAVSAAAHDESLSVSDRLRLDQVTTEILRDGIRQCEHCTSCFPPHTRQQRQWRAEDVPPECLLDTIDAMLAPYIGTTTEQTLFDVPLGGEFTEELHHALVYRRLRALLTQHGISDDVAKMVLAYDPAKSAERYARQAEEVTGEPAYECTKLREYLKAAVSSLASGNIDMADRYLDSASGVANQATEIHFRPGWSTQVDAIKANRVELSRVLGEINEEHARNWQLWTRVMGNRAYSQNV